MSGTYESTTPEIEDVVENALAEMKHSGVFVFFRSQLNGHDNFFDPKKGYVKENDASSVGSVLDMYLDAIDEGLDVVGDRLKEPELKDAIKKAIEPSSTERKILLAYWGLVEDTPWYKAAINISDHQSYQDSDFPSFNDINRVVENIS